MRTCTNCGKRVPNMLEGQTCAHCGRGTYERKQTTTIDLLARSVKKISLLSRELFPEHHRYNQYIELPEIRTHNKTKKITREIAEQLFDYDNTKLTWKFEPKETKAIVTILNKNYSALEIAYLIKTGIQSKRWNSVQPIDGDWENTSYENIKEPNHA